MRPPRIGMQEVTSGNGVNNNAEGEADRMEAEESFPLSRTYLPQLRHLGTNSQSATAKVTAFTMPDESARDGNADVYALLRP